MACVAIGQVPVEVRDPKVPIQCRGEVPDSSVQFPGAVSREFGCSSQVRARKFPLHFTDEVPRPRKVTEGSNAGQVPKGSTAGCKLRLGSGRFRCGFPIRFWKVPVQLVTLEAREKSSLKRQEGMI